MNWLKLSRAERNRRMLANKVSPCAYPKSGQPGRWLTRLNLSDDNPWTNGRRWLETAENFCRSVKLARDISRSIRHKGWYVDSFQDDTTEGVVLVLPHGRFAVGCTDPWNDGSAIIARDVYTDETEAARAADSIAESYAQELCEADEKDQADQKEAEAEHEAGEVQFWAERDVQTLE